MSGDAKYAILCGFYKIGHFYHRRIILSGSRFQSECLLAHVVEAVVLVERCRGLGDVEIEASLWQEVEEAREAELAEELNEAVTDVELTAEASAQESIVEPPKPESAKVVENKPNAL